MESMLPELIPKNKFGLPNFFISLSSGFSITPTLNPSFSKSLFNIAIPHSGWSKNASPTINIISCIYTVNLAVFKIVFNLFNKKRKKEKEKEKNYKLKYHGVDIASNINVYPIRAMFFMKFIISCIFCSSGALQNLCIIKDVGTKNTKTKIIPIKV